MANTPKLTFLFPFRWLTEDKEFLAENIKRMIEREGGQEAYEILASVSIYRIEIKYRYKEPIANFPLTLAQVTKALKPFFRLGRCAGVDINYEQTRSKTMLPLCDFRIYF